MYNKSMAVAASRVFRAPRNTLLAAAFASRLGIAILEWSVATTERSIFELLLDPKSAVQRTLPYK
jgi:hypothetical protein